MFWGKHIHDIQLSNPQVFLKENSLARHVGQNGKSPRARRERARTAFEIQIRKDAPLSLFIQYHHLFVL